NQPSLGYLFRNGLSECCRHHLASGSGSVLCALDSPERTESPNPTRNCRTRKEREKANGSLNCAIRSPDFLWNSSARWTIVEGCRRHVKSALTSWKKKLLN